MLSRLQRDAFSYFADAWDPRTGLVRDSTDVGSPCSIAALGFALSVGCVAVERGWMARREARALTLAALRTLRDAPQGSGPRASGHRGFFYHFLRMEDARRTWRSELSTMDTAILMAGVLMAGAYFDRDTAAERELRELSGSLYRRVEWDWARDEDGAVAHGWRPSTGFIPYHWRGHNEALLLYLLALGSPTHPLPAASYDAWTATYAWKRLYGIEHLYGGPLFVHQLPLCWLDLRAVADGAMRERGLDHFENARRATLVQRGYALRNPRGFRGYGERLWGLSASDGPGPGAIEIDGRVHRTWVYRARGAPWGPDDGTVAPGAVLASVPFTPDAVILAVRGLVSADTAATGRYGIVEALNPSIGDGSGPGWASSRYTGVDRGPVVLMIENHLTGLPWELMRAARPVRDGLCRAGFSGGWLEP